MKKYVFLLTLVINSISLDAQLFGETELPYHPYEVLNYENKLRIQWPLQYKYKHELYGNHILALKEYIPLILANINEISYECDKGNPVTVDIVKQNDLYQVRINNTNNSINYLYKDTTLIFTGYHHIRIPANYFPMNLPARQVILSFDDPDDLRLLETIDLTNVKEEIKTIGLKENIKFRRKLSETREVIFNNFDNQFSFGGKYMRKTENKLRGSFSGLLFGSQKLSGIGSSVDLGYGKYMTKDDGKEVLLKSLNLTSTHIRLPSPDITLIGVGMTYEDSFIKFGSGYILEAVNDPDKTKTLQGPYLKLGTQFRNLTLNAYILNFPERSQLYLAAGFKFDYKFSDLFGAKK